MKAPAIVAALLSAAVFSSASSAKAPNSCVTAAEQAALAVIARTPNLGQMTVAGRPYEFNPGVLRVEVDVFGTPSLIYHVDVTLDPACNVLATTAQLENNPWYRR